jgi:hypothetical protein
MRKRQNTLEIAKKIRLGKRDALAVFMVDNNSVSVEEYFRSKFQAGGYNLPTSSPNRQTLISLVESLPEKQFFELKGRFDVNQQPENYTSDVIEALNNMGVYQEIF